MSIKLYNSLTNKVESFIPVDDKFVRMYNCGPTVYGRVHIGNIRSFLMADLLKRFLNLEGYQVRQAMNITDVGHMTSDSDEGEDKLQVAADKEKLDPWKIADKYKQLFIDDLNKLNIDDADVYPRATQHINEMIEVIKKLIDNGYAYVSGGNVYFDITKFPEYGKLSGNVLEKLQSQERAVYDPYKRNPQDFVLWFSHSKYKNHIMNWDSPWGEGYPGWHIECSAMALKYLTDAFNKHFDSEKSTTIDIHTGGEDNKFPHHECEIAQSEGATGQKFVNYWMHVTHLLVEGDKMSKSLNNIYTLPDILNQGYKPEAVRYVLLTTHYRQKLNFTFKNLQASQNAIDRLQELIFNLKHIGNESGDFEAEKFAEKVKDDFIKELENDLNIAGAIGVLFEAVKTINKSLTNIGQQEADILLDMLKDVDKVLGVLDFSEQAPLEKEIQELIEQRDRARDSKDFATADKIRDNLKKRGIHLIDTPEGTIWKREQ
ncbi:cysteinyl-tRNA synthetase [Methanohalobium evestigatum Z-7303]|uniref:Cysteine--tRNA ligase n=1 Tax=Methanohalobium evestigatum (strain ATCC BAA-1072 / DSM 3721 / NBRC 107634 / OCM 161 / Z-7303) TaxID=644295 RepID=D7E783_METEZ|nr:cysteine--tRNA ligase [Methanohalobium evestigatum]ADI73832.1 cysteinyl-tRNA synthetase [Methanohalobium evestigatum Z-7303]